ncbi:MAG: response regulator [Deltaproteobacteria bacterium]|nr:response regulator [Deltaproteobacteria bacterium]
MQNFTVMIVEDDFMVAKINRKLTEAVSGFTVVHIAHNGKEALSYLETNQVDLIILDIYLPDIPGIELLKMIRGKDYPVDFILITAAHDPETVEASIRYGVFDYVIKPFDSRRYEDSLLKYKKVKFSLRGHGDFNQKKLDELIAHKVSSKRVQQLPKGITSHTLGKVETAIDTLEHLFTIDDVMQTLSFSRVTARRYLEYLCDVGHLEKSFEYKKVGRPTLIYSKKEKSR